MITIPELPVHELILYAKVRTATCSTAVSAENKESVSSDCSSRDWSVVVGSLESMFAVI